MKGIKSFQDAVDIALMLHDEAVKNGFACDYEASVVGDSVWAKIHVGKFNDYPKKIFCFKGSLRDDSDYVAFLSVGNEEIEIDFYKTIWGTI